MTTKLGNIVDIQIGYQPKDREITSPGGDGVGIIQIKDVDQDDDFVEHFLPNAPEYRLWIGDLSTISKDADLSRYSVQEGDLLFLSRGSRNYCIPITPQFTQPFGTADQPPIFTYYFYRLSVKVDGVMPEYVAWFINQSRTQYRFDSLAQGSHMKMVNKTTLQNIEIPIPNLEVQRKIIDIDLLHQAEKHLHETLIHKKTQVTEAVLRKMAWGENKKAE
jgi:hypothetical protein